MRTARHQRGSSRYTSAAHTASAVSAAAGPSPVICPVVHNIVPVVATTSPATVAATRPAPSRRGARVDRDRGDDAGEQRRQARRVDRVQPEDVARVEQREVKRTLRREDVAVGDQTAPHVDDARAVDGVVERQRA